jgi:hypothetical protein
VERPEYRPGRVGPDRIARTIAGSYRTGHARVSEPTDRRIDATADRALAVQRNRITVVQRPGDQSDGQSGSDRPTNGRRGEGRRREDCQSRETEGRETPRGGIRANRNSGFQSGGIMSGAKTFSGESLRVDRWCFICRALRRFERTERGGWRCADCKRPPSAGVARDLGNPDAGPEPSR